jgi:hypothetical protein
MEHRLIALLAIGCLLFIGYLVQSAFRESRGRFRQDRIRRARFEATRLPLGFQSQDVRPEPD